MLFSSATFLFAFLPIVLGAYFALRTVGSRNVLLVVASLLFYAWGEPGYVAMILASIAAILVLASFMPFFIAEAGMSMQDVTGQVNGPTVTGDPTNSRQVA